jgi:hypothetical protein
MNKGPVVSGRATEELYAIPSEGEDIVPGNMKGVKSKLEDTLLVSKSISGIIPGDHERVWVIPDGNRGAILPGMKIDLWGRSYLMGLKGIGARSSMFEDGPLDFSGVSFSHEPYFTSESWFGENPWGAMSRQGCIEDKGITELAGPEGINGFYICPMIRAVPLPKWLMDEAKSRFWYRRLDRPGPYYQQVRLMPSDVRLFYQSEATLGRKTNKVLEAFKITSSEDLDAFIDNYICSGIAALTLIPRTVRNHDKWGIAALDYFDVWLDKDSVIAPDGTIFFADIEGLDWVPLRDEGEANLRIKRQFNRNYYEFMYGLDNLLKKRQNLSGLTTPRWELRQVLAARLELALARDPFVDLKMTDRSLYINMKPGHNEVAEVSIKMLDFK